LPVVNLLSIAKLHWPGDREGTFVDHSASQVAPVFYRLTQTVANRLPELICIFG